jgi:hypothetical protein
VNARRAALALRMARNRIVLWIAFLLVHLWLGWLCLTAHGMPLGDVTLVYLPWAEQTRAGFQIVGIDAPWVYPVLALVPIMLPLLAGAANYAGAWLTMVLVFDAVAFVVLTVPQRRRNLVAAWWWLGFLLLLGPIALARLDAVSVAIVIVALLWLGLRPRLAAVLLSVATWIKVWPAAILASLLVASRHRWRMVAPIAATSVIVVALALAAGSGLNVFSFITQQTGRGLQIEAPISTLWMWRAAFHVPGSWVYYDQDILTFQVTGAGIGTAAALMTPLLAVAAVAVLLIGVRAMHHGAASLAVLPTLCLAMVTTMIVFNKVGSPQYIAWLAPPVIIGLIYQGRRFRSHAVLVALVAALTQAVYPYLYDGLLVADPVMVAVLTARNVALVVLLGWSVTDLWRCARAGDRHEAAPLAAEVWPFSRTDKTETQRDPTQPVQTQPTPTKE